MIELHSHSLLSDGVLLPTEALRRAQADRFQAYAITDHVDTGNVEKVIRELVEIHQELQGVMDIQLIPGVEITHVPPALISRVVNKARAAGAQLILVHGETISEPVAPGTNRAAIEAGCDIIAHPGLITSEEVRMAAEQGVYLEISGRKGHCLGNGALAQLAREHGARLVINSDAHEPGDVMSTTRRAAVARGAGMTLAEVDQALDNMKTIAQLCSAGKQVRQGR